ncbi:MULTISPECIES: hypothetical protein [unclassified Undibacterium]|uniref:hypothetical protein n=1 Tax=unclassified Undibacterium TaxID=2630295 RepID=UPI003C2BD5B1
MPGSRRRKAIYKYRQPSRRKDVISRLLVDIGLHYLDILGQTKIRELMLRHAIAEPVITRVLEYPAQRRRY